MNRKVILGNIEKAKIVEMLYKGKTTIEIVKTLERDLRKKIKIIPKYAVCSAPTDKMKTDEILFLIQRIESCLKKRIRIHPFKSNNKLFASIGAPNMPKN